MLRETCPKSQILAEADPGKTHKILTPLIQLLPEPELSIQILHEDKRKKKKNGGRKRGRPSLTYTFLHRGPLRLYFGNHRVFPEHKYSLIKALFQGFPGGAMVKGPPATAGDTGSSPGPGRSHMPWSN